MQYPFTVSSLSENLGVLRDDLLPGGTKRRGLALMLGEMEERDIFYAGTTMGHGAIALAYACADTGKTAHIYISARENDPALITLTDAGAVIYRQEPLPIEQLHAMAKERAERKSAAALPPGFDMPAFEFHLGKALGNFDAAPYSEIWTCAVTGTLTRALQKAFPSHAFKTVKVVKAPCGLGAACVLEAPEKYYRPASSPPPYAACPYTDAKIWQFAQKQAAAGALVWNTAG